MMQHELDSAEQPGHDAGEPGSSPSTAASNGTGFAVFLSHNSKDKPAVGQLAEELKKRGLHVWLDEWELIPGHLWQEALEEIIRTTKSAAVLVGADGFGPAADREGVGGDIRGLMQECRNAAMQMRKCRNAGI